MTYLLVKMVVVSPFRVEHSVANRVTLYSPLLRLALHKAKVRTFSVHACLGSFTIHVAGTGAVVSAETPSNQLTTERLYSGTSSFTRTVWLPRPVDSSRITAKLTDGVLTLKAPKMEDQESIKINVD